MNNPAEPTQEAVMAEKGYWTLAYTASKVGRAHSTVARWVRSGKVRALTAGQRVFVDRLSLIEFLGEDMAEELGL